MARNGKNHKGGRPKGARSPQTLEREAILRAYRQRVMGITDQLLNSQLTLARGQTYLYKIEKEVFKNKKGEITKIIRKKPELVTAQYEIEQYLEGKTEDGDVEDPEDTYYFLTTKDPDNQAIVAMMDRTFGKSVQSTDVTSGGEKIDIFSHDQMMKIAKEIINQDDKNTL